MALPRRRRPTGLITGGASWRFGGNVTSIFDHANTGNGADFQCFTYDGQRRLTDAWTPKTADCATTGRTVANLGGAASSRTTPCACG
ncbi:hypothetical protein [Streptomyces sp. CB02261]|uniref:hypothetical protein n=1 Tax=Streptomyces sp. CB02261 TaxID=1703940 RepID=UPI0011613F86|nr:hypothetical protein [Streptomyces sp. CB02261]